MEADKVTSAEATLKIHNEYSEVFTGKVLFLYRSNMI